MKPSKELQSFLDASPERQAAHWKRVREAADSESDFKRWLAEMDDPTIWWPDPPQGRIQPSPTWNPSYAEPLTLDAGQADPDRLDEIPPREYWYRLTGERVPEHGRVRCPFPDHEDEHPDCMVYREIGRGWWCPVCGTGGTAINLASALTGIQPRGKGFHDLLRWIGERL